MTYYHSYIFYLLLLTNSSLLNQNSKMGITSPSTPTKLFATENFPYLLNDNSEMGITSELTQKMLIIIQTSFNIPGHQSGVQ
jgi:hypothetical protein